MMTTTTDPTLLHLVATGVRSALEDIASHERSEHIDEFVRPGAPPHPVWQACAHRTRYDLLHALAAAMTDDIARALLLALGHRVDPSPLVDALCEAVEQAAHNCQYRDRLEGDCCAWSRDVSRARIAIDAVLGGCGSSTPADSPAPAAGGETTENQRVREVEALDVARFNDQPADVVADTLRDARKWIPSSHVWAVHVALHRLAASPASGGPDVIGWRCEGCDFRATWQADAEAHANATGHYLRVPGSASGGPGVGRETGSGRWRGFFTQKELDALALRAPAGPPRETEDNPNGAPMRCFDLTVGEFTRDDLILRGLSPAAADEIVAFAERIAAKPRRHAMRVVESSSRAPGAASRCGDCDACMTGAPCIRGGAS